MVLYTNPKYIEWKSAGDMHDDAKKWNSELQFIATEYQFLEELLGAYFLKLSSKKYYDKAKDIALELSVIGPKIRSHIENVMKHNNDLEVLIDGVDEPYEEKEVKAVHKVLQEDIINFISQFNELKSRLFVVIQRIMKETKGAHLLK